MADRIHKSEAEWRESLTPEQYEVVRKKGTERPYTGRWYHHDVPGTYRCVACGNPLFDSEAKYASGSGWPSFYAPLSEEHLKTDRDESHGMIRTEVMCARCDAHLGHVFPDGPRPTGLRYCVNSVALDFEPASDEDVAQPPEAPERR